MFEYQEKYSKEVRTNESAKIKIKYPDRIPVIVDCEKSTKLKNPNFTQNKFLVPKDITMSQFIFVLRRRIKLEAYQALYCMINNSIPVASDTMETIFQQYKSEDGFLYITYSLENTFG